MRTTVKKPIAVLLSALMLLTVISVGLAPLAAFAGVSADGDLPTLTFYVPETIYLNASDNKTFRYYVNREQTDAGALRTAQDTTGLIYFKCPEATAVTGLTVNGASASFSATSSATNTLKATVNSGALSSAISMNSVTLLTWTVTFTYKGHARTATAYSVAYAPNRSVTANASYGCAFNNDHRAYASTLIFIGGAHVTPAAYANTAYGADDLRTRHYRVAYQQISGNYKLDPLVNGVGGATNGSGPLTWTATAAAFTGASNSFTACQCVRYVNDEKYPSNTQWTTHCDYNPASAEITIDKSRYSNANQVPNLKLGFLVTDWDNITNRKNWFVSDSTSQIVWNGDSPTLPTVRDTGGYGQQDILKHDYWQKDGMGYACFEDRQGTVLASINNATLGGGNGSGDVGVKYHNAISFDLSSLAAGSTSFRLFRGAASGVATDAYAISTCAVSLKITAVDKGSLRTLVNNCVGAYMQPYYTAASWSAYKTALEAAEMALGNPTAAQTAVNAAVTNLTAAKNGLTVATGASTVNHVSVSGKTLGTDTTDYTYGDTVTATANSYDGYTYTSASPASLTAADVTASTTNWTLTYTPDTYDISIDLAGGEATNSATYTIESDDITLAEPTKTGYAFTGWTNDDLTEPTKPVTIPTGSMGDRSFTANFAPVHYTLTLDAAGGDAMEALDYTIESADAIPTPVRAGYDFTGWTVTAAEGNWTAGDAVADGTALNENYGDATLTANWALRHDTAYAVNHYYMLADGTYPAAPQAQTFITTTENTVNAAQAAVLPEHYTLDETLSDATVTVAGDGAAALNLYYARDSYSVAFNVDGTQTTDTLYYGAAPAYTGETPALAATGENTYTFLGWTANAPAEPGSDAAYYAAGNLPPVTADVTYYPYFGAAVNSYDITFTVDGVDTVLSFPYGATPAFNGIPEKAADAAATYTFSGWSPALAPVTENATYTAQFASAARAYAVRFVTPDGTNTILVDYGEVPAPGFTPAKAADAENTYAFAGWSAAENGEAAALAAVTQDAVYYAVFTATPIPATKYLVTVHPGVGSAISLPAGNYEAGTELTFTVTVDEAYSGSEPIVTVGDTVLEKTGKEGLVFSYALTVNSDVEVSVSDLTKNTYTIKFLVEGVETEKTFVYGETPDFGSVPTKAKDDQNFYAFSGWEPEIVPATADATYTAQFEATTIPTHEHDFATLVRTVPATCVSAGYDEYICDCGMTEQQNQTAIDPANHAKDPILVGKRDATETEDGYSGDLICPACGETITEGHVVPKTAVPHEHDFATLVSHADATCAAKAYDIYACSCGETKKIETGEVNPDNHVGLVTVGAKDATETEYGYTGDTVCTACGSVLAVGEVVEKLVTPHVHSFDTVIEEGEATCIAKAYVVKQCECGETQRTETGDLNPDNHAGSIILVGAREATATLGGYTGDRICTACGETVETGSFTDPIDPGHTHDYSEVVETGDATCVAKAYTIYQCACGDTKKVETGSVNSANHAGEIKLMGYHAATETADGYSGDKYCLACGKLVEAGHVLEHTGSTTPTTPTNPDTPGDGGNAGSDSRTPFLQWLLNLIRKLLSLLGVSNDKLPC